MPEPYATAATTSPDIFAELVVADSAALVERGRDVGLGRVRRFVIDGRTTG